ncbi:MAG: ester cyclase [Kofleriaceae bacterium]
MTTWMVLVLVCGLGALGCENKRKQAPPVETASGSGSAASVPVHVPLAGKQLAAAYLACNELLSTGKLEDYKTRCITADFLGHPVDDLEVKGADAVIAQFTAMRAAFSDLRLAPQHVFVHGRTLLAVGLMTGTHDGAMKTALGEIAPTKKRIGILFFHKLAVNELDKATEEWWFGDPATLLGQIGALPKGSASRKLAQGAGAPIIVVAAGDPKERANLEIVKKMNVGFNAHKVTDQLAGFADTAVEADQANATDTRGKPAIAASHTSFHTAFPDGKLAVETLAVGDHVIQTGAFTGTHTGRFDGLPATDTKLNFGLAEVIEVADGKIVKLTRFRNGLALLSKLGLMSPPGDEPSTTKQPH